MKVNLQGCSERVVTPSREGSHEDGTHYRASITHTTVQLLNPLNVNNFKNMIPTKEEST